MGRIVDSSNHALLCEVELDGVQTVAIHKPTRLERPLWDYPDGTLTGRERAAYLVSQAGDFEVVPPTVIRDGPWGSGSVQAWVGDPEVEPELVVDIVPPDELPDGWLAVVRGEDSLGRDVLVVHAPDLSVRTAAVFDALINNSDRKGSHLVRHAGGVRGFDHGVSLGVEPKLRTVLWGWAGDPIPDADLARVERLRDALPDLAELPELITDDEVAALELRAEHLLRTRRHPRPRGGWPAIPWPAM